MAWDPKFKVWEKLDIVQAYDKAPRGKKAATAAQYGGASRSQVYSWKKTLRRHEIAERVRLIGVRDRARKNGWTEISAMEALRVVGHGLATGEEIYAAMGYDRLNVFFTSLDPYCPAVRGYSSIQDMMADEYELRTFGTKGPEKTSGGGAWCRRCSGPVADGSGYCGEC